MFAAGCVFCDEPDGGIEGPRRRAVAWLWQERGDKRIN